MPKILNLEIPKLKEITSKSITMIIPHFMTKITNRCRVTTKEVDTVKLLKNL